MAEMSPIRFDTGEHLVGRVRSRNGVAAPVLPCDGRGPHDDRHQAPPQTPNCQTAPDDDPRAGLRGCRSGPAGRFMAADRRSQRREPVLSAGDRRPDFGDKTVERVLASEAERQFWADDQAIEFGQVVET